MNGKNIVLKAAKKLYDEKLVAGTSGNISLRNIDVEDSFYITPSGLSYDIMTEEDIVEIDSSGKPKTKGERPSSEWQMHLEIYKKYPNINAIVHTHSTIATGFAVNQQDIPLILIEMKPFLGGDIKVSPFRPAGSKELAEVILPYLENRTACLLANHGVITVGKTMEEAFVAAEYVEDAAKIYYYAKTSGTPVIVGEDNTKIYLQHFLLDTNTAKAYAKEVLDYFAKDTHLECSEIGDGNINYVFKVWDKNTGTSLVIKQADIYLRSSGRPLDLYRNKIEAEILKLQGKLAKEYVPKVYNYDQYMYAISMEDISEYKNLRKELLIGKTFTNLAHDITNFLANTLLPTTDLVMNRAEKKTYVKLFTNIELCDITEDLVFTEPYYDYKGRN
ncbi:class II aldolase/adducin family protein, partial [Romboutsia sp.]|uniref:class II aldolase/adducin family protein n=1 Tax=Romboutsia sp. TaxID=1965302 RepID=UPI003F2D7967